VVTLEKDVHFFLGGDTSWSVLSERRGHRRTPRSPWFSAANQYTWLKTICSYMIYVGTVLG